MLQPRYGSALQALIAGRVMSHVREVLWRRSAGYSAVSAAHANSTCQALKLMSAAAGLQSIREIAADALEQFINMQHTRVFAYMPLRVSILRLIVNILQYTIAYSYSTLMYFLCKYSNVLGYLSPKKISVP